MGFKKNTNYMGNQAGNYISEKEWSLFLQIQAKEYDIQYKEGSPSRFVFDSCYRILNKYMHWERSRILDLGCGSLRLLETGQTHLIESYTGIDYSEDFVKLANYKLENNLKHVKGKSSIVHANILDVDQYFNKGDFTDIVSIYVLEHIPEIKIALNKIESIIDDKTTLWIGLPTEGGLAYYLGRQLTTQRYYHKKYGLNFNRIMKREHCNNIFSLNKIIKNKFDILRVFYFPFMPIFHFSLTVTYICKLKRTEKL